MSNARHAEYTPLMADEQSERATVDDSKLEARVSCPGKTCRTREHLSLLVVLAVITSLISLVVSVVSLISQRRVQCGGGLNACVPAVDTSKAPNTLAYGMPTKGAAADTAHPIHMAGPAIGPTEPFKTFRISSLHPDHGFPVDRNILLTENDMSLAEFYLPVSGFTHCALRGTWPRKTDLHDDRLTLEASTSRAVDVDVWDVSALSSLNASHVTWIGRPSRKRHLGSLSAAYGIVSTTAPFRCVQGFPFIIDLSCSNPGCTLEYRMDDKEPKLGIELIPR